MPRKTLMPLTATAMAMLLWLLVGCTDGRGDGSGQQPERPQKERSTSRTSINSTGPTTASEQTTGNHRETQQKERPCSSRATQPAHGRRKSDKNPHFRIAFTRPYSDDDSGRTNIWATDVDGSDQSPLTKA